MGDGQGRDCVLTQEYPTAGRAVTQNCVMLPYHCDKYAPGENMSLLHADITLFNFIYHQFHDQ